MLGEARQKLGESETWLGLRYAFADVRTEFDLGNVVPGIDPIDYDQKLSGLTPLVSHDTRDNLFTPTQGLYGEASVAVFDRAFGGDRDFQLAELMGLWFQPLGENAADLEAELRWQAGTRWSWLAFAGVGAVWHGLTEFDRTRDEVTGGLGLRYLAARKFGLHMGLDVAFGPDDPIIYFQFGSAWFRP